MVFGWHTNIEEKIQIWMNGLWNLCVMNGSIDYITQCLFVCLRRHPVEYKLDMTHDDKLNMRLGACEEV